MTVALGGCGATAVDLLTVDDAECGHQWLKDALQLAVTLELATIPVYSCGLWSIKDPGRDGEVHRAIREIIFDEMSHFGLACNILSALGGTPVLADPTVVPRYPGNLPGGVQQGLEVCLTGLDRQAVQMYSHIEMPDRPVADGPNPDVNTSIGAFYGKVRTVLRNNRHLFGRNPGPQMNIDLSKAYGGGAAITPVRSWEEADTAIGIITAQSEGTGSSPDNPFPGRPGDLAHYYVFREIYHGRRLVKTTTGETPTWDYTGPPVPMPETYPMARVPEGAWENDPANAPDHTVAVLLDEFNAHYSSMLRTLEAVWRTSGRAEQHALMGNAAKSMGSLRTLARVLVRISLPDGRGTYGPEFRYTEREP